MILVLKESGKFSGKSFVISGSFEGYTRKELEGKLESYGLVSRSSVSKNTDYLLVGDSPGSKLDKAIELGVNIIDKEMLNTF